MNGRYFVLAAVFFVPLEAGVAQADMVLVGWDFGGLNNNGPSPMPPTTPHPSINVSGLTRGHGVGGGGGANDAWGGSNWVAESLDGAVAAGRFATFSLTPVDGYLLSLSSINDYNIRRSNTGPTTGQWQYQIGEGGFFNLGSSITWGLTTTAVGNNQSAINLSTVGALQKVSETVTFRVVNWSASGSTGTWYFNNANLADTPNDLVIQGTVTSVPEPNALLLVAAAGALGIARRRCRRKCRVLLVRNRSAVPSVPPH